MSLAHTPPDPTDPADSSPSDDPLKELRELVSERHLALNLYAARHQATHRFSSTVHRRMMGTKPGTHATEAVLMVRIRRAEQELRARGIPQEVIDRVEIEYRTQLPRAR